MISLRWVGTNWDLPRIATLGCFALGFLCLSLSLIVPWYEVPRLAINNVEDKFETIGLRSPASAFFKMLISLALPAAISVICLRKDRAMILSRFFSILLSILLIYPYCLHLISPKLVTQAAWLDALHYNLTWLGGDAFTSQETKHLNWKMEILVVDPPAQAQVYRIPISLAFTLQWGRMTDFSEWLGLSRAFLQFVCKGWFLAWGGVALMLLGISRGSNTIKTGLLRQSAKVTMFSFGIVVLLAMLPIFCTSFYVGKANHAMKSGNYNESLHLMYKSAKFMPTIKFSSYFLYQVGLIEYRLDLLTSPARYYRAIILEDEGFHFQSQQLFRSILADPSINETIRRNACRGLLKIGLNLLNSQNIGAAIDILEFVLLYEPENLKANYALQLAYKRSGQTNQLRSLIDVTQTVYNYFNAMNKRSMQVFMVENLYQAAFIDGDLEEAAILHQKKK